MALHAPKWLHIYPCRMILCLLSIGEYLRSKQGLPSLSLWALSCERRSSPACTQYTSRVWMPPPQRAVWLPRLLSCWLSRGSTRHSVHSAVLQLYLDKEDADSGHVFTEYNFSPILFVFVPLRKSIWTIASPWINLRPHLWYRFSFNPFFYILMLLRLKRG